LADKEVEVVGKDDAAEGLRRCCWRTKRWRWWEKTMLLKG